MRLNKWKALLKKDIKLTISNHNLIILMLLPLAFALLYTNIAPLGEEASEFLVLIMVTNMGFMMIGSSAMGMSIAEEKEKKTLRSIMLSGITGLEFLFSKMIIIVSIFIFVMVGCFILVGAPSSYLPTYLLLLLLTTVSLLFLSSVIGIISPNQQAVGILGMPLMLISGFPMISVLTNNSYLISFSKLLPTGPIMMIIGHRIDMFTDYSSLVGLISMMIWVFISLFVFKVAYTRNQFDN